MQLLTAQEPELAFKNVFANYGESTTSDWAVETGTRQGLRGVSRYRLSNVVLTVEFWLLFHATHCRIQRELFEVLVVFSGLSVLQELDQAEHADLLNFLGWL